MSRLRRGDLYQCKPFAKNGNTLMLCTHARAGIFTRITIHGERVTLERGILWGKPDAAWTLIGMALTNWNGTGKQVTP